ncbi:MAG: DUF5674 family protein [Candidatus Zixiibacteriota bacterium]
MPIVKRSCSMTQANRKISGTDWFPKSQKVQFEALINIRPRQGNQSMEIQDSGIRSEVESIATQLLGGVG